MLNYFYYKIFFYFYYIFCKLIFENMKNFTERNIPRNLNDDLNNRLTSIFETINNIKFDSYQSAKNNFELENNLNLNN